MAQEPIKLKINKAPPFLSWQVPTESIPEYLDINEKDRENEQCAASLYEALRFGTHILNWLRMEYRGSYTGKATSMLFAEQLRKLDALYALFKSGAQASAPILIRSMTETLLYFKYIFNEDSERRAKSILFMGKIRRLDFLKELQESTPSGKQVRDLLSLDAMGINFSLGGDGIPDEIKQINMQLSSEFADILAEYESRNKPDPDRWYRLFGGPNELRKLAENVEETGVYYMCYRSFNEHIHGTHVFREEKYWSKPGASKFSVRPLKANPLFDESFFVMIRSFMVALDHVHINRPVLRDWFFSCKLLALRGFENFTMSGPDGKKHDIELS
jgi:hypothetical protein